MVIEVPTRAPHTKETLQASKKIHPKDFTSALQKADLGSVVEVPCSYFKDWLNYLWDTNEMEVINPANEALVMGRAAGRYLATGKVPIVAMQNSGFMNSLNALTSLHQIYNIPAFYITTWRGEGGVGKDAPEHDITGEHLLDYLTVMQVPYEVMDPDTYEDQIKQLSQTARDTRKPVALVIRKGAFETYDAKEAEPTVEMNRLEAITTIKNVAKGTDTLFVSSTGFPTRDSFAAGDTPDFYIMGSMGHAFEIGLGIAESTEKKVVVLDGDGSALMHAGGLADFDPARHKNLIYVVLDNGSYESTGGQPAVTEHVNWEKLAESFRFKNFSDVDTKSSLEERIQEALATSGGQFIHVRIHNETLPASRRVSDVYSAPEVTDRFMEEVKK